MAMRLSALHQAPFAGRKSNFDENPLTTTHLRTSLRSHDRSHHKARVIQMLRRP